MAWLSLVLIGAVMAAIALIAWKLLAPQREEMTESRILRELLENLRKDIQDSKEKNKEYLQERMDRIAEMLTRGMTETSKTMQGQFRQSADIIKEVTEKLTKLDETNKQVLNFSEQLKDLESILKQPKGKGILSEYWLETMLGHVLQPGQYQMQYAFLSGEVVDAVVFFQEKIIPIDAKFSSENYNIIVKERNAEKREQLERAFRNDLKLRIDETAKYIRPEEGTTDFAFMFLPAEGIFYDLLISKVGRIDVNRQNLIEYAFSKRVVIASPATFFAYLQTVLQGLKAFRMEQSIRDVLKKVEQLNKHLLSYEEYMQKLGNNLGTTVNMYNQAYREFQKVDKDILKLTDGTAGGTADLVVLDKPSAHIEETAKTVTESNTGKKLTAARNAV